MIQLRQTLRLWPVLMLAAALGCDGSAGERGEAEVDPPSEPVATAADPEPDPESESAIRLPSFEDYPATETFAGEPAAVDLASHPDGRMFRTALRRDAAAGAADARFAGHYRIVVIGCGTSCKAVWAVDLEDGSLHHPFTASLGVAYRPDSRLLVENGPEHFESLLTKMTVAEVEHHMATYGPPRFWVENGGEFERVGPEAFRIDAETGKPVAAAGAPPGD